MKPTLNPQMLALARELRGLTQSALAKDAGVTQSALSKAEAGLLDLSEELLGRISAAVRLPVEFFRAEYQYRSLPLAFRRRITVAAGEVRQVIARANAVRFQFAQLLKSVDVPELRVPMLDLRDYKGDVSEVAKDLRRVWPLPDGPVPNLMALLESAGVFILEFDFGTRKIDALAAFDADDDLPPLILVNPAAPADRVRFSLAHELGHLVLHHHLVLAGPQCEDEADEFASEFLMPAREIRAHLLRLTLERAASLKPYWRVSMAALIMRAAQLGAISDMAKRSLFTRLSQLGYRLHEPVEIPRESPSLFRQVIEVHVQKLGYSENELVELLKMSVEDAALLLNAAYPPRKENRPAIRRVK